LKIICCPACSETGLEVDDVVSTLGEDFFMSTVWACAFENLLTREFDDGSNIVDDYLKRRGWKETASGRTYMAALRNSVVSLYEVSDVVRDTSFRARDLLRGGEPILISERSATRVLKQWDRIAGRVVKVGSQTLISGAVLPYQHQASEDFIEALRKFGKLSKKEKRSGAGFKSRSSSGKRDAMELGQSGETGCGNACSRATAGIADLRNDARRWRALAWQC
jgi:hypothetical protein